MHMTHFVKQEYSKNMYPVPGYAISRFSFLFIIRFFSNLNVPIRQNELICMTYTYTGVAESYKAAWKTEIN